MKKLIISLLVLCFCFTTSSCNKKDNEIRKVELLDSGFSVSKETNSKGEYSIYTSIKLRNPNTNVAAESVKVLVRAFDEKNKEICNEPLLINTLYPNVTIYSGTMAFLTSKVPKDIKFDIVQEDTKWINPSSTQYPNLKALEFKNVVLSKKNDTAIAKGSVYNPNNFEINSALLSIVFMDKEGTLLGGLSDTISIKGKKSTTPFEVTIPQDMVTAKYKVYALPFTVAL